MKIWICLVAVICLLGVALVGCALVESSADDTRIVFPHATINGQPALVMLDTGSSGALLSSSTAKRFGVKVALPATGGSDFSLPGDITFSLAQLNKVPFALSGPVRISAGGGTFTAEFPLLDLGPVAGAFDGLIGWPEVRDNILVFDSDTRTVQVVDQLPSEITRLPPENAGWLKLKIHRGDNLVLETPLPEGKTGAFSVDTGSYDGVGLPAAQWQAWKKDHPQAVLTTETYVLPGLVPGTGHLEAEEAQADEIKLGQLTLQDVPVFEASPAVGADLKNFIGWLGMGALERMDLVVDGPGGFAYLKPKAASSKTAKVNPAADASTSRDWIFVGNLQLKMGGLLAFSAEAKSMHGDFDGGLADFNRAINFDPKNASTYTNRGATEVAKGDFAAALADFNHALELDPQDANAYTMRGAAKMGQSDYDGALADFNHVLELDPENAQVYNDRGWAKFEKDDYDGAIADFTRTIELEPKDAQAYSNRGGVKIAQEDYAGALADLNHALELDPNFAQAFKNRGIAKRKQGDYSDAIADFTHALALAPKDVDTYNVRGWAKIDQGDYNGGLADFNRALELDPKNTDAHRDRAEAETQQGDFSTALADFSRAIELDPKSADTHVYRSMARIGLGDFTGALDDIEQAITLEPDDSVYAQLYRQLLLRRLGRSNGNFAQTVSGWKTGWTKIIGQFLLGSVDETTLLKSALTKDAEPVTGQQCEAYYYIGMMRLLNGDKAGAREFFNKSISTGMKDYYEYGYATVELYRLGHPAKK